MKIGSADGSWGENREDELSIQTETTTCKKYLDLQNCPKLELWRSSQSVPPRVPHGLAVTLWKWTRFAEKAADCASSTTPPPSSHSLLVLTSSYQGPKHCPVSIPSGDTPCYPSVWSPLLQQGTHLTKGGLWGGLLCWVYAPTSCIKNRGLEDPADS